MNYYFDTCIWLDFFENRKNLFGKDLGHPVVKLMLKIIKNKEIIIYSDLTIKELRKKLFDEQINEMFELLYSINILKKIGIEEEDYNEAKQIPNLCIQDALHLIVAKNNCAVLITRDRHFNKFKLAKRPEEL